MKLMILGAIAAGYFGYVNHFSQIANNQFNNFKSFYTQIGQTDAETLANHPFVNQ